MQIQGYNMPDDLYYEENHFWVKVEGDMIVMGMDDFAQDLADALVHLFQHDLVLRTNPLRIPHFFGGEFLLRSVVQGIGRRLKR